MRTHLTEQQERIAILALERGLRVWRDDVTGEFGPTVDVRIGEVGAVGNGSTIVFWRDGSVTVSTTSRNFHEHVAMATRAQAVVAELLIAAGKEAA